MTPRNPLLGLNPPIFNSASPWATTLEQLQELYLSPYTGAVTVRTSLLSGFDHDDEIHQYVHFDTHHGSTKSGYVSESGTDRDQHFSSLNTLGYSPIPLKDTLETIRKIVESDRTSAQRKPFIVSITGPASEVKHCYQLICAAAHENSIQLFAEVNLSCPNIPDKPPPAYSEETLGEYFNALTDVQSTSEHPTVPVGIKTPPYTYQDQFTSFISALRSSKPCPITFITATNTLGSCLVLSPSPELTSSLSSVSGTGIGGMAGAALHPLALGNVATLRGMLDAHPELKHIGIIGVGGVRDGDGYKRMKHVGADVVALASALGREGVGVFERIVGEL